MARTLRIIVVLCGFCCGASLSRAQFAPPVAAEAPRSRVVVVKNPGAIIAFEPQRDIVKSMVDRGVLKLSGKKELADAWRTYVSTQDTVGIKVYSGPGSNSGTRPAVAGAVVEGLLAAGLAPARIIIWDKRKSDLLLAGYSELAQRYGVRLAGAADDGYDPGVFYDNAVPGTLVAGDYEFDLNETKTGRKSYVSKLVTKGMTRIIVISPLLNHNLAGICGNLYSLSLGSVDNTLRFLSEPTRLATAVPEIYALPSLSDHVALCMIDALIGQYQGEEMSLLHYSAEVNQIWLSQDPVALDSLGVQELDRERQAANIHTLGANQQLLSNAALLELGTSDLSKVRIDVVK